MKLTLQQELQKSKHELDVTKERISIELQRDMVIHQSLCREKFEILPQLHANLLKAHGLVSSLSGLSYAPDWTRMGDTQVEKLFESRSGDSSRVREILNNRTQSSSQGNRELGDYYRNLDFRDARIAVQEAKNFVLKNSLFMSSELYDLSWSAAVDLSWALGSLESPVGGTGSVYKDAREYEKSAFDKMEKSKQLIQKELGVVK